MVKITRKFPQLIVPITFDELLTEKPKPFHMLISTWYLKMVPH